MVTLLDDNQRSLLIDMRQWSALMNPHVLLDTNSDLLASFPEHDLIDKCIREPLVSGEDMIELGLLRERFIKYLRSGNISPSIDLRMMSLPIRTYLRKHKLYK